MNKELIEILEDYLTDITYIQDLAGFDFAYYNGQYKKVEALLNKLKETE